MKSSGMNVIPSRKTPLQNARHNSKAEQLVQMNAWPELVVGIGLSAGRGLMEVLNN
jgi:hypothetical protein